MYGSYCFIRQNVLVSPRCDVCGVLVAHSFFQGAVIERLLLAKLVQWKIGAMFDYHFRVVLMGFNVSR